MIRVTVVVLLIGFGTYLAVSWLLSMWLRLRKTGHPFTLSNLFLLTPYEIERNEAESDAILEIGEVGWAKKFQVAELDAQAAELEKKAMMTRADAEASRAQKLLRADGALDRKLATLVRIHELWAAAYTAQRPTPDIVMGGEERVAGADSPAMSMMEVLTLESLKQLQRDLQVK